MYAESRVRERLDIARRELGVRNKVIIEGDVAKILIHRKRQNITLECLIDLEDLPKLLLLPRSISVFWCPGVQTFYCYCAVPNNGKQVNVLVHRFLLDAPKGMRVDHRNHNGLDNRRSTNIWVCTNSQNMLNRLGPQRNNRSSGIRGVRWDRNGKCWSGFVNINGKHHHVGQFKDKNVAGMAVKEYRLSLGCGS